MYFKVTIDFRKGPSFETTVPADSKSDAEVVALMHARENGFGGIPKKVTAKPT